MCAFYCRNNPGIPFSDPIAEGVIIQAADERALKAGTTTDKLFDMVKHVRKKVDIPLGFGVAVSNPTTHGISDACFILSTISLMFVLILF